MWISPKINKKIRPIIISHGYVSNDTTDENTDNASSSSISGNPDTSDYGRYSSSKKLLSGYSWDGCR